MITIAYSAVAAPASSRSLRHIRRMPYLFLSAFADPGHERDQSAARAAG
jgi:hypothetical protein